MGAALVYFVMLPFVLWFSLNQQIIGGAGDVSVQLLPKVSDYLNLVTTLVLAFGLCFQLPVVLSAAGHGRPGERRMLRAGWRYAIVGVFVVGRRGDPARPDQHALAGAADLPALRRVHLVRRPDRVAAQARRGRRRAGAKPSGAARLAAPADAP